MNNSLHSGDTAPGFTLSDQTGIEHTLDQYRGKWVILYFYPKDDTPGCTVEACSMRDNYSVFTKHNAVVLGVSADSIKSHESFAHKFNLPFPLLADTTHKVSELYGAWGKKNLFGKIFNGIHRVSFLINPAGKIAKVYLKVDPNTHVQEVLSDINELKFIDTQL